jgi:hypothetical protein
MNEELIAKIDAHHPEHGEWVESKPHHWQME